MIDLDPKTTDVFAGPGRPQGPGAPGQGRRQRSGLRARVPAREVLRLRRPVRRSRPACASSTRRSRTTSSVPTSPRGQGRAQEEGQAPPHRQGRRPLRRARTSSGRSWRTSGQVRERPRGTRLQVRTAPRRRCLVRSSTSIYNDLEDEERRKSAPSTSRASSPSRSPPSTSTTTSRAGASSPATTGSTSSCASSGSSRRLRPARQAARPHSPDPDGRAQLQPHRARAVGNRQVVRLPGVHAQRDPHLRRQGHRRPALREHVARGRVGLLGTWDVVAFDEVAGLQMADSTVINMLKDFMESGSFARGKEEISGRGLDRLRRQHLEPHEELVRTAPPFADLPTR